MNYSRLSAILCAASLLGLCSYSAIVLPGRTDSLPKALANPDRYAGVELSLPVGARVWQIHPREFLVQQHAAQLVVRVPANLEQDWAVTSRSCRSVITSV
jgi:hypothetical protein